MPDLSRFDSGVYGYIHGRAVIDVYFPVDKHGVADISCRQCPYRNVSSNRCALNGAVLANPEKFVGDDCPLRPVDDELDAMEEAVGDS